MLQDKGQEKLIEDKIYSIDTYIQSIGDMFSNILSNIPLPGTGFYDELNSSFSVMESTVSKLASQFGGTRDLAVAIKQSMAESAASVIQLGGTLQDIANIQLSVVKATQTQTILNKDYFQDLYAISSLVSDTGKVSAETTKEIVSSFINAGYGLYNISSEVSTIINNAKELGVTTNSVFKQVAENMNKLALYNFSDGVQGMAKMAAQAAALRIDMKDTLTLADQLFKPEKAIEMSAAFRRLGVSVTELLDPYKLMDMARNDPEELQKSILNATKSLVDFDEKNQKMRILPGAQGQLRELAEAMGMPAEKLAQMALNAGDLERKMSQIRFPSQFADEKTRTMIANMAQMSGGSYVVQYEDLRGEKVTKLVSELKKEDVEALQAMNVNMGKSAMELQREANGYLKSMAFDLAAQRGVVPRALAASRGFETMQKRIYETVKPALDIPATVLGLKRDERTGMYQSTGSVERIVDSFEKLVSEKVSEAIKSGKQIDFGDLFKGIREKLDKAGIKSDASIEDYLKKAKETIKNVYDQYKPSVSFSNPRMDEISNRWTQTKTQVAAPTMKSALGADKVAMLEAPTQSRIRGDQQLGTVKVDGNINLTTPTDGMMKDAIVRTLDRKEVADKITAIVLSSTQLNETLKGSGKAKIS
jgi:hypothetical protein